MELSISGQNETQDIARNLHSESGQKLAFGLTVASSRIHGRGCFARIRFIRNQQIAEYVGERIPLVEAERRRSSSQQQAICDVDSAWAIDGSRGGNGTQYVNHSCQPNADVFICGDHVFLYALEDIAPGEEITTDYLYELALTGARCNCRTACCEAAMSAHMTSANCTRLDSRPRWTDVMGDIRGCEGPFAANRR